MRDTALVPWHMKRFERIEEGCSAVIEAETEEELLEQASEHAAGRRMELRNRAMA